MGSLVHNGLYKCCMHTDLYGTNIQSQRIPHAIFKGLLPKKEIQEIVTVIMVEY